LARRKRLNGAKLIALVFEREHHELLKSYAYFQHKSLSSLVREIVEQHLKSSHALPATQPAASGVKGSAPAAKASGEAFSNGLKFSGKRGRLREARTVTMLFEREAHEALKRCAQLQGKSVSLLVRELVEEYLRSEGVLSTPPPAIPVKWNMTPLLKVSSAPAANGGRAAPMKLDGATAARRAARPTAGLETASERRWRLMVKLDEPMAESLVKEVDKLESRVVELEKTPVSMRMTESFLNRRRYARQRLVELKKLARYLIRAGVEVPEETVDKLVSVERRLNRLE